MISFPVGLILTAFIFIYSMGFDRLGLYFNFHSSILVGGGTIAIFLLSTPWNVVKGTFTEALQLFRAGLNFSDVRADFMKLAKNRNAELDSKDELIRYGQDLWTQGIEAELFIVLVSQKRKELEQKSVNAIQSLKNLAKYPPALGMAGTVMGIVTLFQNLSAGKEQVGPSLAMALTATFFGLTIANSIVMPLADRMQVRHLSYVQYLEHVYQVLLLVNQEEASYLIEEEVQSRAG